MKASASAALLLSFFAIVVLVYVLYTGAFDNDILDEPKPALSYEVVDDEGSQAVLNNKTDVLGYTVYDNADEIIGTLYDVYAEPKTGEVKWISVNVTDTASLDDPEKELILVAVGNIETLDESGPINVNATKDDFLGWPYQQKHEDKLENLVSLRRLPESPVKDSAGRVLGAVEKVSYQDGELTEIHFKSMARGFNDDAQSFSVPFSALNINVDYSRTTNQARVTLTERQAGAVEAYLND